MALPESRNTNYAAGSQVFSADLNDIQDSIVEGNHGEIEMQFSVINGVAIESGPDAQFTHVESSSGGSWAVGVALPAGTRIKELKCLYDRQDADLEFTVGAAGPSSLTPTPIVDLANAPGSASALHYDSIQSGLDHEVADGEFLWVGAHFDGDATSAQLWAGFTLVVDRGVDEA